MKAIFGCSLLKMCLYTSFIKRLKQVLFDMNSRFDTQKWKRISVAYGNEMIKTEEISISVKANSSDEELETERIIRHLLQRF